MRTRRAVLAALSALSAVRPRAGASQDLPVVRVVGPANDGFRPVYYGVRSGIFRRAGVDVQPTIVGSGAAGTAALVGGSAEVSYTNIVTVIQAHRRGVPMRIIAPATLYVSDRSSSSATLVLKDSPIKTGRDLNGKVLGTLALADINAVATQAWIDETGGDSKSVRMIEVPRHRRSWPSWKTAVPMRSPRSNPG